MSRLEALSDAIVVKEIKTREPGEYVEPGLHSLAVLGKVVSVGPGSVIWQNGTRHVELPGIEVGDIVVIQDYCYEFEMNGETLLAVASSHVLAKVPNAETVSVPS